MRNRMTQRYKHFKSVGLDQRRSLIGQQLAECHRNTDLTEQHSPAIHGSITSGVKIQSGKNLTTEPQLS